MQRRQRFIADQRYDLPQHESMLGYIADEFFKYNKIFFSPQNRIVKNWKIINNGGLSVKVDQTADSFLFNSLRSGKEASVLRKTTEAALGITLSDNAVNYVEVQIASELCALDTVALWDTTANGGNGEEFTQSSMTGVQEAPALISNTIAFTGDPDRLPLAIVTTSGGIITNITDAREMLYHVDTDWSFGVTRTDKTISNSLESYQALATAIKEIKGTPNWYDAPWPSTALLKEFQNLFFTDGGNIEFEGSQGANKLAWSSAINIHIADRANSYSIAAQQVTINEGQAVYVTIPDSDIASPSLAPVVANLSDVPINPASVGFVAGIQVLFYRINNKIYGMMDIPEITSGEVVVIGESMSNNLKTRLGIIDDSSYVAYTSTSVISANDSYAIALSKLDLAVNAMLTDLPVEEWFVVANPLGQTVFDATTITWNVSNSIPDIVVTVNGVKQRLGLGHDYVKTDADTIAFNYTVPENAMVCIRQERTGGGGGGGGSDLQNITVNMAPAANGAQSVGTVTKAFSGLFLKDTATSQVYRLDITSGVLAITPVP